MTFAAAMLINATAEMPENKFGFLGPDPLPAWQHPLVFLAFWLILTGFLTLTASFAAHRIAQKPRDWLRLILIGLIPAVFTLVVLVFYSNKLASFSPFDILSLLLGMKPVGYVLCLGLLAYGIFLSWWAEKAQSE